MPVNDIEKHDDFSSECKCEPRVIVVKNGEMIVVHNLFDGREGVEIFNHILKHSSCD